MTCRTGLLVAAMCLASCSAVSVLDLAPRRVLAPASEALPGRTTAAALPSGGSRLIEGTPISSPGGYFVYCQQNAADCQGSSKQSVDWSEAVQATVDSTNVAVNKRISPANDPFEEWSADVEKGDCEDYALTKRRMLVEQGLPPSSLRIAVATTPTNEMHAVLVVVTDVGDFVLDNRNDAVLEPQMTDLHWIKIASAADPKRWNTVRSVSESL